MSLFDNGEFFINLPDTGKSLPDSSTVISTQRLPTDLYGALELTFTGLKLGTDVVILKSNTSSILESVDQHNGESYTYKYFQTQNIDIGFILAGYIPLYIYNYPLSNSNVSLPIQQRFDRNYL